MCQLFFVTEVSFLARMCLNMHFLINFILGLELNSIIKDTQGI